MGTTTSTFTQEYNNGDRVYEGEWQKDLLDFNGWKRHGKGTMKWKDGAIYTGRWVSNEMEGFGELTFPNGNKFVGNFHKNNPDGEGTLTTGNHERISGHWICRGRSDTVITSYTDPIVKYELRVTVVDEKTNRAQFYAGPGTLHMTSGLVVLPNMNSPNEPVYAYAVAIGTPGGNQYIVSHDTPIGVAVALPGTAATNVPITLQPLQNAKMDPDTSFRQNPIMPEVTAQPISEDPQNNQNVGGIAFGVNDPALAERTGGRKMNLLDPRNYF